MRQYLNNPIASCVSSINLGYAAKQLFVELPVTKQLHSLLTVFVALGVIQSFSIKKPASRPRPAVAHKHPRLQMFFAARTAVSNGVPRNSGGYAFVVYLKYVDYTPVFSGVRNYWLSRRKVIIPYSSLQVSRVQNTKQVFVLWTNRGFLTSTECMRLRIGGLLVCGLFAVLWDFLPVIR